jgi:hypothetical protein
VVAVSELVSVDCDVTSTSIGASNINRDSCQYFEKYDSHADFMLLKEKDNLLPAFYVNDECRIQHTHP